MQTYKIIITFYYTTFKDAARQSDLERERLMAMQRQLEIKKRDIIDQENTIRSKELDLEAALGAAQMKEVSFFL